MSPPLPALPPAACPSPPSPRPTPARSPPRSAGGTATGLDQRDRNRHRRGCHRHSRHSHRPRARRHLHRDRLRPVHRHDQLGGRPLVLIRGTVTATAVDVTATPGTPTGRVPVATFTATDSGPFTATISWGDGHWS